jgi:hypothetical protein
MLSVRGSERATATWALKHRVWFCESSSKHLKWMRGMEGFDVVKQQLRERGFTSCWIPSSINRKLKPPFDL